MALNIKLQFVRTQALCSKLLETDPEVSLCTYSQTKLNELYGRLTNVNEILESYPVHSKYLEELQEYCYKALIAILKCFGNEYLLELADIFRRYQTYAARKLFTLRISILCRYIYIQTEEELAAITSIKIMTVCRGLIEYQYHFLKPKSGLLDTEFDLEWYREPVLQKIESTIRYMQSEQANRTTQEKFTKSLFSQLVIDSLALKVQELDDSTRKIREDKIVSVPELQGRIKSAQERIRYFLKQHDEESQSGYIKFSESVAPE